MKRPSIQTGAIEGAGQAVPRPAGSSVGGQGWLAAAGLAVATLLVFWPAVHCGFVNYDDSIYVFENRHVLAGLNPASIRWALTSTTLFYIPLTQLSFLLDASRWGAEPWGFHLTNVLFHAANAGLLLLLLLRVTGRLGAATMAATLFALHPLRVESVVWITERKDVLSLFFLLLALHAWVGYTRQRSVWRYATTAVLFAAALLAKPLVLTLPLLLLLLDYWPLQRAGWPRGRQDLRRWGGLVLEKVPLLALAAISAGAALVFQGQSGAISTVEHLPLGLRLANALVSVWRYVFRLVRVDQLAVFYPFRAGGAAVAVLAAAALVAVTALVLWQARTRPWWVVGWFWFLVALFPASGIVQSGPQAMADRYTYLSMIGLVVALVWSVPQRWTATRARSAACAGAGLAVALTLCFFTRVQIGYWRDSVSLWHHDLDVVGKNTEGLTNLAAAQLFSGQDDQAFDTLQVVLRVDPHQPMAHADMGLLLEKRGLIPAAIAEFHEALQAAPDDPGGLRGLAAALLEVGQPAEAAEAARRLTRLAPDDAVAWVQLGDAESRLGSDLPAEEAYRRAAELAPDLPGVVLGQADLKASEGQYDEAWRLYSKALSDHVASAETWFRAGEFLGERGRHEEAIQHLRKALELDPRNADAGVDLGMELAARGDSEGAIEQYRRVLENHPNDVDAHLNLSAVLVATGAIPEAVEHAGRAAALRPEMAEAQYDYGALLARTGRPRLAMEHLEAAAKLHPGDPDTVALLASLRLAQPPASRAAGPAGPAPATGAAR